MRLTYAASTPPARVLSLLLTYTLFISLCTPFLIRQVEAASPRRKAFTSTAPVRTDASSNNRSQDTGAGIGVPVGTGSVQGDQFRVAPPAPTQDAPLLNLPNPDEIRNRRHLPPHAPSASPSTRCAPRLRDCKRLPKTKAAPPVDPITTGPISSQPQSLPVDLLASGKSFPAIESLLGINNGVVSDSPFKIKLSERVAASSPSLLAPMLQSSSTENVVWTNPVGVAVSGNSLTKTASSGWGNAGASSTKAIASGNGYMEFTALKINESMVAGLSHGDTDQSWQDIDYGIDAASNGQVYICESGVCRSGFGPYEAGARFKVAIEGGMVKYYKGSVLLDSHSATYAYPLLVDSALWDLNGKLDSVVISGLLTNPPASENVVWTNKVGVTAAGNSLTKIASSGWGNAGASSTRAIASGDGYMTFKADSITQSRVAGLSHGDTDQNWQDIDYGIDPASNGQVYICESGVCRSGFGPYSSGNVFKVAIEGGMVKYYKDDVLLDSHSISPVYPLNVDCALWDQNGLLNDVKLYGALQYADGYTPPAAIDFSNARIDPINHTGAGGEDLVSGNYNWSVPVVSLPGRAGLDLGLSLSYNSLVWTRSGSYITYDADHGFPSPGFRLGFPTIQPLFFNPQTGRYAYLLITPSGGHVELRQTDANPAIYEAADSSYLQLDTTQMILRATDGTQLSYEFKGEEYQCTKIKDRNGNFITVSYDDSTGQITEIKDTLARIVSFVYDGNQNLQKITEQRSGSATPHNVATFGYNSNYSFHTNFYVGNGNNSQLTMIGTQDNVLMPVLTMIGLEDQSYYKFTYTSWGQVSRITHYGSDSDPALDNHALSYVSYNLANDNTARTDCPRFTERRNWAENWNGGVEAVTTFSIALNNPTGTVTLPTVLYNTPTGIPATSVSVMHKLYFGTGVQKGLNTKVETYANNVLVRTSETQWTQDKKPDGSEYAYQVNPRPTLTKVSDPEGNGWGMTIDYDSYASYGLPHIVKECAVNGTVWTVLRETYTEYKMDAAYLERRIIGLVTDRRVKEGQSDKAKTLYAYDAGGEQLAPTLFNTLEVNATQHDPGYNTGFLTRGNLTSVSRYDVATTANPALTTQVGYDTDGSVLYSRDPEGHKTNISYSDSFSDNVNRNTFAYPTSVKDPDTFQSIAKYDYYTGAVTYLKDPKGAELFTTYDAAGRVDRTSNSFNGAFRQYAYGSNYIVTWASVQSIVQTLYAISVFDGAGRVIRAAQDAPVPGVAETRYSGKQFIYDVMGQVEFESNPTEMGSGWVAAGEDILQANGEGGWRYSQQTYDWKGRPRLKINTDGTTREATYGGCGCAGGETVTFRDEVGRIQKSYADSLGRVVKAEEFNQDQSQSTYRTTTTRYNALDQVTRIRLYLGAAPTVEPEGEASSYQTTSFEYDGYGRLWKKKLPQQNSPTIYSYYADDMVRSVQDARGVTTTYGYNGRHLLTGITYPAANQLPAGVIATTDVTLDYDNAGNRTHMTDGMGSATYSYDTLSRMESESRSLNGIGTFSLSYSYNLANEVTSITDPFGSVSYAYDHTGRTTDVTGTGFGAVSQFASNMQYRAWGAIKSISYGNNLSLTMGYNTRLLPQSLQISGQPAQYGPTTPVQTQYSYYADGSLRYAHDLRDERMDRSFSYNVTGRIGEAYTGSEARDFVNQTQSATASGPYRQTYQYDVWGEITSRANRYWNQSDIFTASYGNGRNSAWSYDADGRMLLGSGMENFYDAAGRNVRVEAVATNTVQSHDGDGQVVKRQSTETSVSPNLVKTVYYLRSSVKGGQVIVELNAQGQRQKRYVYGGGEVLATQEGNFVYWRHEDSLKGSRAGSTTSGQYYAEAEFDPEGVDVGLNAPETPPSEPGLEPDMSPRLLGGESGTRCTVDWIEYDCGATMGLLNMGAAARCPNDDCRQQRVYNPATRQYEWRFFRAFADGREGYVPLGATSNGNGGITSDNGDEGWGYLHHTPQQNSNPNCMLNFVRTKDGRTATEVARPYDRGHDGRHDISPISKGTYGGDVIALPALEGAQVIRFGTQEPEGHSKGLYLDIQLRNGMVLVLKDFNSLNSKVTRGLSSGKTGSGIRLSSGSQLGTIFSNVDPLSRTGLHVTLVRDRDTYNDFYVGARLPGRTHVEDRLPWTIDPLDPKLSPFNCPNLRRTAEGLPLP